MFCYLNLGGSSRILDSDGPFLSSIALNTFFLLVRLVFGLLDPLPQFALLKFMVSKKATKIDEIFTVNLTLCSKCQSGIEDFVNFCT